jgi:hypothetical protein
MLLRVRRAALRMTTRSALMRRMLVDARLSAPGALAMRPTESMALSTLNSISLLCRLARCRTV